VDFYEAFVLHRQKFNETSALTRFWTASHGLVSANVKNISGPAKQASLRNAWLQPFQPLLIKLSGRSTLKNVFEFEPAGPAYLLSTDALASGQYLNSLIFSLLNRYELDANEYLQYHNCLTRLSDAASIDNLAEAKPVAAIDQQKMQKKYRIAIALRLFEFSVLESIGFGIPWSYDIAGHEIDPQSRYDFLPLQGFQSIGCNTAGFAGELLLASGQQLWGQPGALATARKIMRLQLAALVQ